MKEDLNRHIPQKIIKTNSPRWHLPEGTPSLLSPQT